MANAMIIIAQKGLGPEELIKMTQAIFRLITSENDDIEIQEELRNQLLLFLKVVDPQIISQVSSQYSKSRSKSRKIAAVMAILQSQ